MAIPMEPITVKLPPDEKVSARQQAESRGFEGVSDYVRHLISADRALLRKQWLALNPIFGHGAAVGNDGVVGSGNLEEPQ